MATPSRTCNALGCELEIPRALTAQGLCTDHYLEVAFQKLVRATHHFRRGKDVDHQTLEWLVAQVDCIVEIVRAETSALNPEKHTKFLELLLGIANLNEHVRRQLIVIKHAG